MACWHAPVGTAHAHTSLHGRGGAGQQGMCSASCTREGERRASKRERRELASAKYRGVQHPCSLLWGNLCAYNVHAYILILHWWRTCD